MGKRKNLSFSGMLAFAQVLGQFRRIRRVDFCQRFHYQRSVRVDQNAAIRIDQKRVAVAMKAQRTDHFHQYFQAQITANDPGYTRCTFDRCGKGHDQPFGHSIQIRFGEDRLACAHGIDIPRPGPGVIVGRHVIRRLSDERTIALTLVNTHEGGDKCGLAEGKILRVG